MSCYGSESEAESIRSNPWTRIPFNQSMEEEQRKEASRQKKADKNRARKKKKQAARRARAVAAAEPSPSQVRWELLKVKDLVASRDAAGTR